MKLLALGLNHETAPIALREQAAFGADALQPALRELTAIGGVAGGIVNEAAILSTCNRTEIYYGQEDDQGDGLGQPIMDNGTGQDNGKDNGNTQPVLDWFSRHTGFSRADLAGNCYHLPNEQAVKHAFRVASGLDSMVLGEPQILGQMKHAFHAAADAGTTGKVLNRLFQHTFSVAKQVRTDTAIGAHSVSVAYAGVSLAKQVFTNLAEQSVLLIGAGETIELVARHLKENGVRRIVIANRSVQRAHTVAQEVGGEAILLAQIPEHLPQADIVVSATKSTLPILGKGAVERALARRKHKPMFILDLAVPRDVEAEVSRLRDVYLYTVDDLKSVVEHNRELRARAADQAEIIIDLQVVRFMRWMRSLESLPAICALRQELEGIGQQEAMRAVQRIRNGADPEETARQLARNLANKFAHGPSRALRQAHMDGNSRLITAARKLFNL